MSLFPAYSNAESTNESNINHVEELSSGKFNSQNLMQR